MRPEAVVRPEDNIHREMAEAERKAWKALAGYKFWMFGYWAAIWVHLNRLGKTKQPNPWRKLVETARERQPETGKTENTRER